MTALPPSSKCSHMIEYDALFHQAAPCPRTRSEVMKPHVAIPARPVGRPPASAVQVASPGIHSEAGARGGMAATGIDDQAVAKGLAGFGSDFAPCEFGVRHGSPFGGQFDGHGERPPSLFRGARAKDHDSIRFPEGSR